MKTLVFRPALQSNQSSLFRLHGSSKRGGEESNGQVVSLKRAADEKGREAGRSLQKRKIQGQKRILAKHLDKLKRNNFCDFEKPPKHAYQKGYIEFNEQSREASRIKFVEKNKVSDRVESFVEVNSSESRRIARFGFDKPIQNGLRKKSNLIESKPSRAETGRLGERRVDGIE